MIKLGYEKTDKKIQIDIYGLIFDINDSISEIDTKNIQEEVDLNSIINKVLGEGAVDKINEQRKKDGYGEINTQVALTIIAACTQTYVDASSKPIEETIDHYQEKERKFNKFNKRNYRNKYRRY